MTIEHNAAEARGMAALAKIRNAVAEEKDYTGFLSEFSNALDTADDETQDRLSKARDLLINITAENAFAAYAIIAASARNLKDGFRLATVVANKSEKSLFFPGAAAHLAEVAALVDQIAKASKSIDEDIGNLVDSFNENDVKNLYSEGVAIKNTIDVILSTLNRISEKFSTE